MAFALNAWSSSLAALSDFLKPLRKGSAGAQACPLPSREAIAVAPPAVLYAASITVDEGKACRPAANESPASTKLAMPRISAHPLRVKMRRMGDGDCRLVISGRMADVCAELDRLVLH